MATMNQNPMLIDPDMKEIVESFIVETKEILDKLDVDLVEMEKRPDDNELLNSVFRHLHTIKGTSSFLGLDKLTGVTHKGEDILNKLRRGEARLNSTIMDSLLNAYDKMKSLLVSIEEFQNEDIEVDDTIKELMDLIGTLENGGVAEVIKKPAEKSKKKSSKTEIVKEVKEEVRNEETVKVEEIKSEDEAEELEEESESEVEAPHIEVNNLITKNQNKIRQRKLKTQFVLMLNDLMNY